MLALVRVGSPCPVIEGMNPGSVPARMTTLPSVVIFPEDGSTNPVMALSNVDLPAPFLPINAVVSPLYY